MNIKDLNYLETDSNFTQVVGGLRVNILSLKINQIASSRGSVINYGGDASVFATSLNKINFS